MDLSGIIFVVLAVGWAVYLLPKALKHNDDLDKSRPVEEFSDAVRVLGRGKPPVKAPVKAPVTASFVEPVETSVPVAQSRPTREAARAAARRRRRVLALLLTTLVAVSVTSYLGYAPWYSTAIPGALVLAFLVVARLTVRAQQVHRVEVPDAEAPDAEAADVELVEAPTRAHETEPDLTTEDTEGISRDELAQAVAAPVLDEGGLWDPLPVTLPTYVNKPRARRTVRTVEITAGSGITSSGHDAADSALAAEAAAVEKEAVADEVSESSKAAGA